MNLVSTMFRKKLFLESVHKLGMSKLKEDAVISLFEATLDPEEVDPETAETPEGDDEPNTEGSAFTEEPKKDDQKIQRIKRMLDKVDFMLNQFRMATEHSNLSNSPNGTILMRELNGMLQGIGLGAEVHEMCTAMRLMDGEVIQLNKAKRDEEFCRIDPNYAFIARNPMARKHMSVANIKRYMKRIDECLETIRESIENDSVGSI